MYQYQTSRVLVKNARNNCAGCIQDGGRRGVQNSRQCKSAAESWIAGRQKEHRNNCAGNEALLGSALFSSCCAAAFQIRRCSSAAAAFGGVCGADAPTASCIARAIGRAMWPAENSWAAGRTVHIIAGADNKNMCGYFRERGSENQSRPPFILLLGAHAACTRSLAGAQLFLLSRSARRAKKLPETRPPRPTCTWKQPVAPRDAHFIKYGDRRPNPSPSDCMPAHFF